KRALGLLSDARKKGLREGARHVGHRLFEAYHEWRLGIRSAGILTPAQLGFVDPDLVEYSPVTYHNFHTVMSQIAVDPCRDVFLDYGCGMGRAVILAATYRFRRVIGVELAPGLAQIALENIAQVERRLVCHDIQIEICDATSYDVPDDVTVIFMNNP